ncbi:TetR/AcrR family transcriptional regulator [Streptomyces gilvus]|uniref:TetR/AcrR family transcriptional regulator n=1 Tax=Streptomyces gilvus TaxID=2920937 RepID=UPI001F113AE6|nr:TetR/AcrR family transcriptional regulator [Streptomyces sp. CME 23]MCH5677598.1 TetR/AcrR family transcriptional regulator [Streptomyces sp. CME 23]
MTADAQAPDWSDRRADARRNHERIVAAALQVFAERGLEATVPEVAARAGVGKATVYRSYPTKDDLIQAAIRHRFRQIEERTAAALADQDAGRALSALLPDLFEVMAADRLLAHVMYEYPARGAHVLDLLDALVTAARDQGAIRPDATVTDLRVLAGGTAKQLARTGVEDPAEWRRYGELVLAALRPG